MNSLRMFVFSLIFAAGAMALEGCEIPEDLSQKLKENQTAGPGALESISPAQTTLAIDAQNSTHKANLLLLGNNIQWVDNADGLWDANRNDFDPIVMESLKQLRITVLRFPGGTLSDAYHWKDAVGPLSERKELLHIFTKKNQKPYFGTDEYLRLIKELGAEPLITVNAWTGTPEEAAEWVRYVNGIKQAGVRYWEIGNEPYLEHEDGTPADPNYPEIFARKFVAFASAMKAVDPKIQVCLPLRNNQLGRYPGGPYENWNQRVLRIAGPHADFAALHNAYFPSIFEEKEDRYPGSMLAQMAAYREVRRGIEETRQAVRRELPGKNLPLAITEYNSFTALPNLSGSRNTASLGAALYASSLLIDFFKDPALLMANFWSSNQNWYFGALSLDNRPRPSFYALKLFSNYVGESVLASEIKGSPVFSSPAAGYAPALEGTPALDGLVTRTGRTLYIILVNRSLNQDVAVMIETRGFVPSGTPEATLLTGPSILSDNEKDETVRPVPMNPIQRDGALSLTVPKHSILAIQMKGN